MSLKKSLCSFLVILCLIPSIALAKSYKVVDIYTGNISTADIVFKPGDKITGGRNLTVEIYYVNADEEQIDKGDGTIKSVTIDGKKCSEWYMSTYSASTIQLGNLLMGSFGFTMMPAYARADSDGYTNITSDTYSGYISNAEKKKGKKVKFSGRLTDASDGISYVSVAEGLVVAFTATGDAENALAIDDNVQCKGEVSDLIMFKGAAVPLIACTEANKFEYMPLKKDDKGAEVLQMKERLRELGYFLATADLSENYNDTCVERVKQFQTQNGLPATGSADVETLTLLFSESAKSKVD